MCDTIFCESRKPANCVHVGISPVIKDDESMKVCVVAKDSNACKTASIESIWNVLDAEYKLSRQSGKNFIVGKIPSKTGDVTAAAKYFKKTDMYLINLRLAKPTDELLDLYHSVLVNGIEMGNAPLITALGQLGMSYELFDVDKF